jgi:hypothetical protein
MYFGSAKVAALRLGDTLINRAYFGDDVAWPPGSYPLAPAASLAWWRADDAASMTLVGGKVSEWRDQISGRAMTQATDARRPVYSATSFSGSPGVTFSSSAQTYLSMASSPWPLAGDQAVVIVVCDQLSPASDTAHKTLFAYGNTAFTQRKVQRLVKAGVNRAAAEIGNTFSTYPIYEGTQNFSGIHAVTAFFGDVNTTVAIEKEFAGVNTLALRTEAGRTRIGADALATPTEFCDCIIRDVVVVNSFIMKTGEFDKYVDWAIGRRTPV